MFPFAPTLQLCVCLCVCVWVLFKAGKHLEMTGLSRALQINTSAKISQINDLLTANSQIWVKGTSSPLQTCMIFTIYELYIAKGRGKLRRSVCQEMTVSKTFAVEQWSIYGYRRSEYQFNLRMLCIRNRKNCFFNLPILCHAPQILWLAFIVRY